MAVQPDKKQNDLNLFLNDYFNIILAAVLILFLILSYFVFLGPKFRATQAAISANTEEKQLLYETTQKRLASLKAISDIYQKISPADMQKFNSVLPDAYVKERLFGEIEEIIGQGGWLVSSISISAAPDAAAAGTPAAGTEAAAAPPTLAGKRVGTVTLNLNISAVDYSGFKNLLRLLESNLRLFDVESVSFSPNNTANIILTTYYYQSL